jgi:hypothetical protein
LGGPVPVVPSFGVNNIVAAFAKIIRGEKQSDYLAEHDLAVQRTVLQACGAPID